MAAFYLTDRDGLTQLEPSTSAQRDVLFELMHDPVAIGDVWLAQVETGWAINVFPSGLAQLEVPGQPLREIGPLRLLDLLGLWGALAKGDLATLRAQPWRKPREA